MTFYLTQLQDVAAEPQKQLVVSESTICLCLAALIPAQYRSNWIENLEDLSDPEWEEAEDFVTLAINELTAEEQPMIVPGQVVMFAGINVPNGWLKCNGELQNISQFPDLFDALGTIYGGDGVTTFGVPDFSFRVPMGVALVEPPETNHPLGETGGQESHAHAHSHTLRKFAGVSNVVQGVGTVGTVGAGTGLGAYTSGGSGTLHPARHDTDTSGPTKNNLPPYRVIEFIIYAGGN